LSASSKVAVPSAIRISSADTSFAAGLVFRNTVYARIVWLEVILGGHTGQVISELDENKNSLKIGTNLV
jgi:hypothetical protein